MNKKIVGILVCILVTAAAVLPAAGMMNDDRILREISVDNRECTQYGFSEYFDMACCESLNKVISMSEEEILREIDETSDKTLVVDKELIGERYVYYWEHKIDDVQIKNDYILLHRDIYTNTIVEYIREWREIDANHFILNMYILNQRIFFGKKKLCF